jgi:hypothetical protein
MHMTPKQFIRPNVVGNDVVLTAEFATMSRTDVEWSMVVACLGEPVTDHESPTMGEATVSRRAGSWTTRILLLN